MEATTFEAWAKKNLRYLPEAPTTEDGQLLRLTAMAAWAGGQKALRDEMGSSISALRDQFAGQAMQGFADTALDYPADVSPEGETVFDLVAGYAYKMADAMLRARARPPFSESDDLKGMIEAQSSGSEK